MEQQSEMVICNLAHKRLECTCCFHAFPHQAIPMYHPNKACTETMRCYWYELGCMKQCVPVTDDTYIPTPKERFLDTLKKERMKLEVQDSCNRPYLDEDAIEFFEKNPFLATPSTLDICAYLNQRGLNQMHGPIMMLLAGESHLTEAVSRLFYFLYGKGFVDTSAGPVKPSIHIPPLQSMTEKALYEGILDCFWSPPWEKGEPIGSLRWKALGALTHCSVRMIFISDFDAILAASQKKRETLLRTLKGINEAMGISIVGLVSSKCLVITDDMVPPLIDDIPFRDRFTIIDCASGERSCM